MLKKREIIIPKVTSTIRRTTHKRGIEVIDSLKNTAKTCSKSKSEFCRYVIAKEMKSIGVAFDVLETEKFSPVRNNRTSRYAEFKNKINFTRKDNGFQEGIEIYFLKVLLALE